MRINSKDLTFSSSVVKRQACPRRPGMVSPLRVAVLTRHLDTAPVLAVTLLTHSVRPLGRTSKPTISLEEDDHR